MSTRGGPLDTPSPAEYTIEMPPIMYLKKDVLQNDYFNLERSLVFGRNSEISNTFQKKCTFCVGTNHSAEKYFKRIRQEK